MAALGQPGLTSRKDGNVRHELLEYYASVKDGNRPAEVGKNKDWKPTLILLQKLCGYSILLARSRQDVNIETLCQKMKIRDEDVISWQLKSGMLRPAYFLVVDREHEEIVLIVRGTYTSKDIGTKSSSSSYILYNFIVYFVLNFIVERK